MLAPILQISNIIVPILPLKKLRLGKLNGMPKATVKGRDEPQMQIYLVLKL
jgi:hypothetical protein